MVSLAEFIRQRQEQQTSQPQSMSLTEFMKRRRGLTSPTDTTTQDTIQREI